MLSPGVIWCWWQCDILLSIADADDTVISHYLPLMLMTLWYPVIYRWCWWHCDIPLCTADADDTVISHYVPLMLMTLWYSIIYRWYWWHCDIPLSTAGTDDTVIFHYLPLVLMTLWYSGPGCTVYSQRQTPFFPIWSGPSISVARCLVMAGHIISHFHS